MRIFLVHWSRDEAAERAQKLTKLGHDVVTLCDNKDSSQFKPKGARPELFVIGLDRIPSHGREIAGYFRRQKSTRNVPILFLGGDAEQIARTRKLLPDAAFGKWRSIKTAITKAIRTSAEVRVVPGTMAGYSGTPLPKKLGIREGSRVVLVNPPDKFERQLAPLPADAEIIDDGRNANVAVLFVKSEADFIRHFRLARDLPQKVAFWIAWPKQASGIKTDLKEGVIREFGLAQGWVDYKICAIDATWSGLCFARQKTEVVPPHPRSLP